MLTTMLFCISCLPYAVQHTAALPRFAYEQFPISGESDEEVHVLVKEAAQLVYPEPREARVLILNALKKVSDGASIDLYDYLWTQYGLLKSSFETDTSEFGPGGKTDYLNVARNALDFLDNETNVGAWPFTELGGFQMEVYREAGNGLAWYLHEGDDDVAMLNEALSVINKTEEYIRGEEDYYILDTKVRILLKLDREQEAFEIVRDVLKEEPDFEGFEDFHTNNAYQVWIQSNP